MIEYCRLWFFSIKRRKKKKTSAFLSPRVDNGSFNCRQEIIS